MTKEKIAQLRKTKERKKTATDSIALKMKYYLKFCSFPEKCHTWQFKVKNC